MRGARGPRRRPPRSVPYRPRRIRGRDDAEGTAALDTDPIPFATAIAPTALRIYRGMYDRMLAHLSAAAPLEAVGLLAVAADGAAGVRATRFYPGTNVDASATRYTMDPAEVLDALRDIDAKGWRLGAIVHSHPATAPTPSATDRREARYPEALLVIVGLASAPPVARAWRIDATVHGDAAEVRPAVIEVPVLLDLSE